MPFDPIFIKFNGAPVAGRVPVNLFVQGEGLTTTQQGEVSHLYAQFRSAVGLSIADFHAERHTLADGSTVLFESMQDRDSIYVVTSGEDEEGKLPHGFAVTTNWQSPLIYKRRLEWDDGENQWAVAEDFVPQVEHENYTYDNQVFKAYPESDPVEYFNLPMVYRRSQSILWDYGIRGGLDASSIKAMPFWITDGTTEVNFQSPHYAMDNTVVDDAGTVLYTVPLADQILLPSAPEPDEPKFLGSSTDAQGNQLAMNHWRFAVISPTFNIWQFRLCNELINRTSETGYAPSGRYVQDIITPWPKQTATTTYVSDSSTGEEIDDRLTAFSDGVALEGYGWFDPPGVNAAYATGWGSTPLDISTVPRRGSFENSMRQIIVQANAAYTKEKVLAVGAENAGSYIDILSELNYPADVFWRGATKATGYYRSDVYGSMYSASGYGVNSITIFRKDTKYHVDGAPKVTARLGWKDLVLLGGTTTGRMDGKVYSDTEGVHGSFYQSDETFITAEPYSPIPGTPNYVPYSDLYAWLTARNVRNTTYQTLMDKYWTTAYGGPNPTTTTTTVFNERPVNTVEYSLFSRYVIDYDHKGRYYAAIRCEVVCSGAAWSEDATVYEGYMKEDSAPTYTVKIWFECNWNNQSPPAGTVSELLLVEETITRPGFEIIGIEKFSPWYWPSLVFMDRSCVVRVPPEPRPDENFMMQLKTLASHQGYNDNLACADVRTDFPEEDAERVQSVEGIEYSYLKDGRVVPHERYVTGQLYARTFKLSDFYEAFWMLHQLKVSAIEDDFQPIDGPEREMWHYHPLIKAALAVTRHIEVRDGGIINWSDDIDGEMTGYPPAPAPKPAYNDREIRIHRV